MGATVLKLPTTNAGDELPNPMNPEIQRAMQAELTQRLSECETQADATAMTIMIVGKWFCRAARVYASDRDERMKKEFAATLKNMIDAHEELARQVELMRHQAEIDRMRTQMMQ
jgi:hypothetical protein